MKNYPVSTSRGPRAASSVQPLTITIPAAVVEKFGRFLDYFSIPRTEMGRMLVDGFRIDEFHYLDGFWQTLYTYPSRAAAKAAAKKTWAAGSRVYPELTFIDEDGDEAEETFRPHGKAA